MNATAGNPVIKLEGIHKKYGRRLVLDNINLEVPAGCVFALLGENGAGKSTLIRGLMGYHRFDSGSATVAGMDPVKQPMELRGKVAYVSDAPGLYEWMTVAEAGWYASGFYAEGYLQRYTELCQQFALAPDAKIQELSKGMRAKTALALAVACNPDLLILDEPTSGLDPLVRRSFLESMIDRAADGQTVFLSSHQIHEVERVADYVAILHEGRLQVVATLEELKTDVSLVEFSMRDPLLALPSEIESSHILHRKVEGRTTRMMVQKLSQECRTALERDANIFELKILRPNLEELYIGFTQPLQPSPKSPRNVSDVA